MSIVLGALAGLAFALGAYIVTWITNRPEGSDATTEEINRELRRTFRQKDELEFLTLAEYLDPVLDILASQFSQGFERRQLEMLRFRIENQTPGEIRSATYPVSRDGEESELELQWILNFDDRIHVRIAAPGGSLEPVRDAVVHSPGQIFSESLISVA